MEVQGIEIKIKRVFSNEQSASKTTLECFFPVRNRTLMRQALQSEIFNKIWNVKRSSNARISTTKKKREIKQQQR